MPKAWIPPSLDGFFALLEECTLVFSGSHWSRASKALTFRCAGEPLKVWYQSSCPFQAWMTGQWQRRPRERAGGTPTHFPATARRRGRVNLTAIIPLDHSPSVTCHLHNDFIIFSPSHAVSICFESPPSSLQYQWNRDAFHSFAVSWIVLIVLRFKCSSKLYNSLFNVTTCPILGVKLVHIQKYSQIKQTNWSKRVTTCPSLPYFYRLTKRGYFGPPWKFGKLSWPPGPYPVGLWQCEERELNHRLTGTFPLIDAPCVTSPEKGREQQPLLRTQIKPFACIYGQVRAVCAWIPVHTHS